jgi:hypothetical protein
MKLYWHAAAFVAFVSHVFFGGTRQVIPEIKSVAYIQALQQSQLLT